MVKRKKYLYRYFNKRLEKMEIDEELLKPVGKGLYGMKYPVQTHYGFLTLREAKKEEIQNTKDKIKKLQSHLKKLEGN